MQKYNISINYKMKTKLMMLFAAATMLVACGGNTTKNKAAEEAVPAIEIDALLADAATMTGQEVVIEGLCTHACQHGATKIFLMGSNETKTIRVEACELGAFKQECVNSIVRVTGKLVEDRIDEAYLQAWEARSATEKEHGEEGEGGCSTEKAARGETGNSVAERIADFRAKIAAEKEATGKEYLAFYHVDATSYEIVEE